eukprot:12524350-Heterocapsa_arctica.AAC.1
MNTTPVIMGVTQNTMTMVGSEMYDKYLLAKSDLTFPDTLNCFGGCNAIMWYHLQPPDADTEHEGASITTEAPPATAVESQELILKILTSNTDLRQPQNY